MPDLPIQGGQPGNQNARKHGFYSHALTPDQQIALSKVKRLHGLDEEIAVTRIKLKSILTNDSDNYPVVLQALAQLYNLTAEKRRQNKFSYRKLSKALGVLVNDLADLPDKPKQPVGPAPAAPEGPVGNMRESI